MKNLILVTGLLLTLSQMASAQRYFTRDARVQFNSDTPVEKIEAINKSGTAVLDTETGRMEWKVLIKNFVFEKALMQEHFNENYMESTTYPNATFKGNIANVSKVNFAKGGSYAVTAKGKMTIHGVTKEIEVPGTIIVGDGTVKVHSDFKVACADYDISIPGVVREKIAQEIAVSVDATLDPMKRK
ncbi:MAG: YceI family protein [Bacteroidetes bacterium]|nr:MAG: YceI family protein [Bacteroidota bacterium]